jgi:hypothetical protein
MPGFYQDGGLQHATAAAAHGVGQGHRLHAPRTPPADALAIPLRRLRPCASWDPASPPTASGAAPFPISRPADPWQRCAAVGWRISHPPSCHHMGASDTTVYGTADPWRLRPTSLGLVRQADAWTQAAGACTTSVITVIICRRRAGVRWRAGHRPGCHPRHARGSLRSP